MTTDAEEGGRAARLLHQALLKEGQGDAEGAMSDALEAQERFGRAGDRTGCAAALQLQAILHTSHERPEAALDALDNAVTHREATGDQEGLAVLHQERFALAVRTGRSDLAQEASESMLEAFERVGERVGQAQGIHQLVQFLVQAGELDAADEMLARGLWLTDRAGEERARSALVLLQVQADLARGLPERAELRCKEAIRLAEQARNRPALVEAWQGMGGVHMAMDRPEEARAALEQALDGRELLKDLEGRAATLGELAQVEQMLGLLGEASDHLAYAARTFGELEQHEAQVAALLQAGELAHQGGLLDQALRHGEALVALLAQVGASDPQGQALFINGQRRVQNGDLPGAALDFVAGAEAMETAGNLEGRGIVLGMLGQVQHALGRTDEALETLAEAERVLTAVGSEALAELAPILAELRNA